MNKELWVKRPMLSEADVDRILSETRKQLREIGFEVELENFDSGEGWALWKVWSAIADKETTDG